MCWHKASSPKKTEGLINVNPKQANVCEVHKGRSETEDDWTEDLADRGAGKGGKAPNAGVQG